MYRSHVLICGGTGCTSSHSPALRAKLAEELKAKGLDEEIQIVQTGCFGLCALGPVMIVYPEGTFYSRVTVEDIPEIVDEHLLKGRIVERLVYNDPGHVKDQIEEAVATSLSETGFYKKQKRVALRNCGVINPESIEEYIAMDGYFALAKVLKEMTPDDVIKSPTPVFAAAAAADSPPAVNGVSQKHPPATKSTSSAMRTRATPVPSWTVPFWKATRTACWKPWPSPVMPSAPTKVGFTSVPSTPLPLKD